MVPVQFFGVRLWSSKAGNRQQHLVLVHVLVTSHSSLMFFYLSWMQRFMTHVQSILTVRRSHLSAVGCCNLWCGIECSTNLYLMALSSLPANLCLIKCHTWGDSVTAVSAAQVDWKLTQTLTLIFHSSLHLTLQQVTAWNLFMHTFCLYSSCNHAEKRTAGVNPMS